MDTRESLSCSETAKIVRDQLKKQFPAIKFSVRSKTYSGGASISINWTDGPLADKVKAIAEKFEGASFDGMIDLKSYNDSEWQGKKVHFGSDYIFCNRSMTDFDTWAVLFTEMLKTKCALDYSNQYEPRFGNEWVSTIANRAVHSLDYSIKNVDERIETAFNKAIRLIN